MIRSKRAREKLLASLPHPINVRECTPKPQIGTAIHEKSIPVMYTPERCAEMIRCKDDPLYFMERYAFVQHPTLGAVPMSFKNRQYLKHMVDMVQEVQGTIVKHPRQAGITTTMVAYALWMAIFKPYQTISLASAKFDQAKQLRALMGFMLEHIPAWMKPHVKFNNQRSIEFENGTAVLFDAVSDSFCRGRSLSFVYIDNFAYIKPSIQQHVMSILMPCLPTGGKMVIASTPSNMHDTFEDIWSYAEAGDHSFFHAFPIGYWDLPIASQGHWKGLQEILGKETMLREYDAQFVEEMHE